MVQNPPKGYHSVTPYLIVKGAKEFMAFAEQAFGATLRGDMMEDPRHGVVGHAEMQLGSSVVMFADEMEGFPATSTLMHVYVDDVDATHAAAIAAGATPDRAVEDQFYGDRSGSVKDAWGNTWYLATHKEDVSPEEMGKRMEAQFAG